MKERLLALLAKKEVRKKELGTKAETTEDIAELRGINSELATLNKDIEELRGMINALSDENEGAGNDEQQRGQSGDSGNSSGEQSGSGGQAGGSGEQRGQAVGAAQVLGTYGFQQHQQSSQSSSRSADKYDTPEYRSAFMDYALKGIKSESLEFRADAITKTTDIGAVIPTTIINKIIEKMNSYGMIWSRVTKTNIKGGVELPISTVKPTATWVAEGSVAEKQKKVVGKISFAYHKLQIRVAVTLEADTVSLVIFEQSISDNIAEAMTISLEEAIISGIGEGQPLGITKDTGIANEQKIAIAASEVAKYNTWTNIISKIPLAYESKVVMIMTKIDWDKNIVGMTDSTGQPIARVTYGLDGKIQRRFLGYEVILVEGYLSTVTAAETDAVWGVICNLADYIVNTNLQITHRRYFDENTDEWISKSTMICDGKLGDKNSVLLLTKKAAV